MGENGKKHVWLLPLAVVDLPMKGVGWKFQPSFEEIENQRVESVMVLGGERKVESSSRTKQEVLPLSHPIIFIDHHGNDRNPSQATS